MAARDDHVRERGYELAAHAALAPVATELETALRRLDGALVVAVAGQLSAGKSTLVNALTGRDVAATGAAETTLVPWWLRRGLPERTVVRRRGLPALELPVGAPIEVREAELDVDDPEPITVWLDSPLLEDLVVVDTPGLFSPRDERSARARELLGRRTATATASADAALYVTSELPGSERDAAQLDAIAAGLGQLRQAPTNVLLVLSKADRFRRGTEDPLAVAGRLLDAHRTTWRTRAWEAVAVSGLLAEGALVPGALPDAARGRLRDLALHEDAAVALRVIAAQVRAGRADAADVDLWRRLGPYGVEVAVAAIARGEDLARALQSASGIGAVRDALERVFRARAEVIRTDRLLATLEHLALARRHEIGTEGALALARLADDVRAGSHGRELRALRALRLGADPRLRLPEPARDDVRAVFASRHAADRLRAGADEQPLSLAQRARERARWWRALEAVRPSGPERRWLANEMACAHDAIARSIERGDDGLRGSP